MKTRLNKFTDSAELHHIGHVRLAKLIGTFQPALAGGNLPLPTAPDENNPPANGEYFDAFSSLIRRPDLPEPLLTTLATIEYVAAPENAAALDAVIQRRLSCISLKRDCPLDCALEVFFACPDELAAFRPSVD